MKHMLAKDAWKEMIDRDPVMRLVKTNLILAYEPVGHSRCDVCKRLVDNYEMVYQDEKNPITICEQCYDPEKDYSCLAVENTFRVHMVHENR
jgi:hypothetical protein